MHPSSLPLPSPESIWALFRRHGHEAYHGEAVSQLEHAAQAADLARQFRPADPEFQVAAFLHDIGHLCGESDVATMEGFGTVRHEAVGATFLESFQFPYRVTQLVGGHVEAKRYLVAIDPEYFAGLSEASRYTLIQQGGPMSETERTSFESDPLFELHILLRRIDDQAKDSLLPLPDLSWLEPILEDMLERKNEAQ